jgi:hypothetical protein
MTGTHNVETALWEREREFWTGAADFYRRNLADNVLMVFPGMTLDRDRTIASIANAPRWATVTFDKQQCVPLSDDVIALHYRAVAVRVGDPSPYNALITSVYVRRNAEWLLAIHQQTP